MTSSESGLLRTFYEKTTALLAAHPDLEIDLLRAVFEQTHHLTAEPINVSYSEVDASGRPALWCVPPAAEAGPVILYLHGGGFMLQSMHTHRKLAGHLAKASTARVLVLDYRYAPEAPFPAQLDDIEAAYIWLLDQGVLPAHLAFAGDSAGANLAMAATLRLRDQLKALPAAVVGISPWFDLTCAGLDTEQNQGRDALLSRPFLENMAAGYLGGAASLVDPLASPLHADLHRLPPVYLCAGGDEALVDAQRFADQARHAGVDVTFDLVPRQQHVYPVMAGRAAEADRAIAGIADWLAPRIGSVRPRTAPSESHA